MSSECSFDDIKTQVNGWLLNHPNVKLILSDDTEKHLYFEIDHRGSGFQFCIRCPLAQNSPWSVHTDCDIDNFIRKARNLCGEQNNLSAQELLDCIHTESMELHLNNLSDCESDDNEDDDEMVDYTNDDIMDDDMPPSKESESSRDAEGDAGPSRFADTGSSLATRRLFTDMKALQKSEGKFGISGNPREDNLYIWDVKLTDFEPGSTLATDLNKYATKYKREEAILLEMTFQNDYPMTPPFVRIVRPRFKFLTGHVTIGGSICMQMLTRSGWSPGNDIESILIQIRSEIMSDPQSSLDLRSDVPYDDREAKDAFMRMVQKYKWN